MNIRKKLAVAAAVVLPVSGMAVLGGLQLVASAGGPPILSCASLGSDSANPLTGGITFDNQGQNGGPTGPGTAGLDLGAGLQISGSAPVTTTDPIAMPLNTNIVQLGTEAIAGQTLSIAGQNFTIVSDSAPNIGVANAKTNIETAIVTPDPSVAIAKKATVTINPSTTGTYSTFSNTSVSDSTNTANVTVTSGTDFNTNTYNAVSDPTGDVGAPITVTYNSGAGGYVSPYTSSGDPTTVVSTYIKSVQTVSGVQSATIWAYNTPSGTPGTTDNSVQGPVASQFTDPVVVTVGSTAQATNSAATDYDLALSGCQSSLFTEAGVIYPNTATLQTPTGMANSDTGPGSALGLESGAKPITGATVAYPGDLPADYSWGDSGAHSTSVTFDSTKDYLCLKSPATPTSPDPCPDGLHIDEEGFIGGSATGGTYDTAKAAMTFGVGSMVVCTEAQALAIGPGNGTGSGIDSVAGANHIAPATSLADVGTESLEFCDGGPDSALTAAQPGSGAGQAAEGGVAGFIEVAGVEGNPNGGGGGFDGSPLAAIWEVSGDGTATL